MNAGNQSGSSATSVGDPPVPWSLITGYFLASRVFIFVLGYLSTYIVEPGPTEQRRAPLEVFRHWDTDWYLRIAHTGYPVTAQEVPRTAFFPLYPLLIRALGWIVHDFRVAGYLLSNAFLFGSCAFLWRLVVRDHARPEIADRAVLFLLFGPVSFFFSTIYTESLFFFLLLGTIYFATARQWLIAGCFGYLAALTRPVGILVVVPLAFEFAMIVRVLNRNATGPQRLPRDTPAFLTCLLASLAGLATYCIYLERNFGHPFEFLHAEEHWHRQLTFPGRALRLEFSTFYDVWFHLAVVLGVLLLILGFALKIRPVHSVLAVTYFLVYLSASHLEAIPRFLTVLFPFYITTAIVATRQPRLEPVMLAGSAMLLAFSIVLFANGYWFT